MQASTRPHHDLISNHIGLARKMARSMARRLPGSVERQDIESVAMVALTEAAHRYDRRRPSSFQAYAACRIRGAVLDELRRRDPVGRRERDRIKQAEKRGVKRPGIRIQSLEDLRVSEPAADARPVDEQAYQRSRLSALRGALGELPERMKRIISLYYSEGKTQAEIGAELGVTESRVCQLRRQALRTLRHQMTP